MMAQVADNVFDTALKLALKDKDDLVERKILDGEK